MHVLELCKLANKPRQHYCLDVIIQNVIFLFNEQSDLWHLYNPFFFRYDKAIAVCVRARACVRACVRVCVCVCVLGEGLSSYFFCIFHDLHFHAAIRGLCALVHLFK